jgi:hypothetical protein
VKTLTATPPPVGLSLNNEAQGPTRFMFGRGSVGHFARLEVTGAAVTAGLGRPPEIVKAKSPQSMSTVVGLSRRHQSRCRNSNDIGL